MPSPDPSAGTVFRVRAVRGADEDAVFRRVEVDVVDARAVDVTATFGFAAAGFAAAGFAAEGFAAAGFAAVDFAMSGFARALGRARGGAGGRGGRRYRPSAGWGRPELLDLGRQLGNFGPCFRRLLLPLRLDVAGLLEALLETRQFLFRVLGRGLGACRTG